MGTAYTNKKYMPKAIDEATNNVIVACRKSTASDTNTTATNETVPKYNDYSTTLDNVGNTNISHLSVK